MDQPKSIRKIYIASGWWLPGHKEALEQLEAHLTATGHAFFSPRLESQVTPTSSKQIRHDVFQRNLIEIVGCRMVIARIDDWDPGTVWEMGFAFSYGKPTIAWSLVPGRKLNLMLSESCEGFINGMGDMKRFFLPDGKINSEVALSWQQEVE